MSAKAEILKEEFEFIFDALAGTLEGVDDKEFKYRLTEASNDIQSILNHLSRITNLNMMRVIKGNLDYTPLHWPDDYVELDYGLDKLMSDLREGSEKVIKGVAGLSDSQLEQVIPLMSGPYPRKIGLFTYVGELFHHRGQIAFIRGTVKRLRERDPEFLK
jgi:uncharacterized damage-inducible protein DinB